MKCPTCQANLEVQRTEGIAIDECVNCRGRWFDRGELRLAKDREGDDLRWLDFDPFGDDAESLSVASEGKECPKCSNRMNSLAYREPNIVIDKYPHCEGVWLDHREFDKIVDYLNELVNKTSTRDYTRRTFQQFLEMFKGPEGVVSETKDLLAAFRLLRMRFGVESPEVAELSRTRFMI